jgi:uncharacterized protein with PQ loop repeat
MEIPEFNTIEIIKQVSGILLSVCFAIAYFPQIIRMIRNKSSKDVSLGMLILNLVGYSSGLIYITTNEIARFWVMVNYVSGICMTILTVFFWKYYIRKEIER